MAVFGAPVPQADHADRAVDAARAMHTAQMELNKTWKAAGQTPFGLGLGVSTGLVAAALLGSEERLEYTLVGDTVNLTQRLQQWAEPGETVLSERTWDALTSRPDADALDPAIVKGRETPVSAHRFPRRQH
jgi:class 3 adenylate cyclase